MQNVEITEIKRYSHKIKVGNETITLEDSIKRSETELVEWIANMLYGFAFDSGNKELLFYRKSRRSEGLMDFWFSFPVNTPTNLDFNSSQEEIQAEFKRIYYMDKEKYESRN